jgi:Holliday junction resolvase RusA-like endonuclease
VKNLAGNGSLTKDTSIEMYFVSSVRGYMTIIFSLPFLPMSKSNGYKIGNGKFYKPAAMAQQEADIKKIINGILPNGWAVSSKPFKVEVWLHYADKRRRDVDGAAKLLLDCMNGIVYKDDSQIQILYMEKMLGAPAPLTFVICTEL